MGYSKRWVWFVLLWLALLAAAAASDATVSQWVKVHTPFPDRHALILRAIRSVGHIYFTVAVAVLLILLHPLRWRAGGLLCLSAALGGLMYSIVKWVVGRPRPGKSAGPFVFHPFKDGLTGLFHPDNLSFFSGHTCLAFATAHCLAILLPRWRWAMYAGASVVAVERVLQGAHYPSDVVAGAAAGILCAELAFWLGRRLADRPGVDGSAPAKLP